ncbi:MAG: hypothetical protein Q7K43_04850 [Candidatus Woesearchaeota archaeon]|nr:hypothetical protein [Candidatus Woesearchaeota archaeon]
MNHFIYLSWLENGKYWHTHLSGRKASEPLNSAVEGYFVLFKEQNGSHDRSVLIGMLQEDLLSNNNDPYTVIESVARDGDCWERVHGHSAPLKDPSHAVIVAKGMYSVARINREATLYADTNSDIHLLKQVATKSKSLININIANVLNL